jgi:hypothetical protein
LKVASFTVHATAEQSIRWKRAAEAEGHRSAGTWLAAAADAYLKVRAKAGLPLPLAWRRHGRFTVRLESGEEVTIRGQVSPPFAAYQGNAGGQSRSCHFYTLVYTPDGRIIATLRTFRQAKALAAELAAVLLRGDPPPPAERIVERHEREAK